MDRSRGDNRQAFHLRQIRSWASRKLGSPEQHSYPNVLRTLAHQTHSQSEETSDSVWICLAFAVQWMLRGLVCLHTSMLAFCARSLQMQRGVQCAFVNLLCSHLLRAVECVQCAASLRWWMDVPLTTGGDREPGDMDQSLPHSPPVSLPATTSTRTLTAPHCPHHILLPHTTTTHHTAHTTSYYTPPHTTINNSNILPFLFHSVFALPIMVSPG